MSVQIEQSGIEVRAADERDIERWNDYVARSPHGNPFHLYEALECCATHSQSTLHPLVGFKGQEPIGLLPMFSVSKGPMTAAFSPPPDLLVSYLGPALLNQGKLKQRKAERRHRRFIEGCIEWLDTDLNPQYIHLRTDGRYSDLRPFKWNEFDAAPSYTYVVDLSPGIDDVLMQFSGDARSNIRSGDDHNYEVTEGGAETIEHIIEQVQARYNAQDEFYGVTPEFVVDLYESLPDGCVRPYALTVDGEFQGGMVALEYDNTVYRWQGGAKPDVDLPVNDLVDWQIIQDAIDRGINTYDLVGANNPRLCGYKAKFDPSLRTYHSLERGTRSMNMVSSLYKRFR